MALNFKVYVPKESTLTELGTVASQIPGGKIGFTPGSLNKYLAGSIKAISILLTNKEGESDTAPLSVRVSATIKDALAEGATKAECLSAISKLMLVETKDGGNIIAAPRGEGGEEEQVSIEAAVKSPVTFGKLVAF
jgi:hypothetical protein